MTDLISSISGYFSKSLILGTFLPVVVFIVLAWVFLIPYFPVEAPALAWFQSLDAEWKALAISFIVIVLSGLIFNLNIPILRLYEGYPWRDSFIGKLLTRRHQSRFDDAQIRIRAMRASRTLMQATSKDLAANKSWVENFFEDWKALGSPLDDAEIHTSKEELQVRWDQISSNLVSQYGAYMRDVQSKYPDRRGLILPTRLGNAIRSFEYYPGREYRIDSIAMWPRLIAIIPKDYAVAIDDAKTTFDFMLNCSALSLILAASVLLAGLIYPDPVSSSRLALFWLGTIAVFAFLFYFFYRLAINRVGGWGSLVNGAFDLYRSDLLKKLGYEHKLPSRKKERELWQAISRQIIYGDIGKTPLDYIEPGGPSYPSLTSTPAKAKLEITKGVKTNGYKRGLTFYLRIRNTDSTLVETDVVLTDTMAVEYDYEWNSAKVGTEPVHVAGTDPYYFNLGSIAGQQEVVLTYNGIRRARSGD